jgi:hypothetical protein
MAPKIASDQDKLAQARGATSANGQGPAEAAQLAEIAARYTPVDWHRAFAAQPAEIRWLVEPVIEQGTAVAIFGAPDSHKSLFMLELCYRYLAAAGRTAVYVDQENRVEDMVARLAAFGAAPAELGRLLDYSFPDLPPLDTPQGGRHLLALAEAGGADLVVLDTTSRMVAGKENDSDTYNALYNLALRPLKARGIASVRIDHTGKNPARGQRGSSAKDGDVDVAWWMRKQSETRFILDRHRDRTGHVPPRVEIEVLQDPVRHAFTGDGSGEIADRAAFIADVLDSVPDLPDRAGRVRCRQALADKGIRASNAQLDAAIRLRNDLTGTLRTGAVR